MQLLKVPKVLVRHLYHAVQNHFIDNMRVWLSEEPPDLVGTERLWYTSHTPYWCSNKNAEGTEGDSGWMASISTAAVFRVMTSISWTIVHSYASYIQLLVLNSSGRASKIYAYPDLCNVNFTFFCLTDGKLTCCKCLIWNTMMHSSLDSFIPLAVTSWCFSANQVLHTNSWFIHSLKDESVCTFRFHTKRMKGNHFASRFI